MRGITSRGAGRAASVTRAEIRAALFERRTLVRTSSLRSTLHLHSADDLPEKLPKLARSRLAEEADRLGSFLESSCHLRVTGVG